MRLNLRPWGGVSRLLAQPWAEPETRQWFPDDQPSLPLVDPGTGAFTADAYISGTVPRSGSFTANAYIQIPPSPPAPQTSLTADAVIRGTGLYFEDNFNRTEASGFGASASDGSTYVDAGSSGSGTTSVDGSQLVVDNTGAFYTTGVYVPDVAVLTGAEMQFDFYVGADPTEYVQYGLFRQALDFYVEQDSGGDWALNFQWIFQSFTPDPNTWYTAKVVYGDGPTGGSASKVWKRGDPEPAWQVLDTHGDVIDPGAPGQLNIFVENDGTDVAMLDNVQIRRTGAIQLTGSLTADAITRRTVGTGPRSNPLFVGSSRGETRGGSVVSVFLPPTTQVGDFLIAVMRSSTVAITSGWSQRGSSISYESTQLYVQTRVATADDVAAGLFNLAAGGSFAYAHLTVWHDANDVVLQVNNSSFGATAGPATDTWVGVAPSVVQITWAQGASSLLAATIVTPPSGMTEAESARAMATYYEAFDLPGQLGTKTLVWSASNTTGMLQLHIAGTGRSFTADAYFVPSAGQTTVEGSFTADAWITRTQVFSLTADAYIVRGGRTRHSSAIHFGEMYDTAVSLSAAVGAAPQGSTLHDALVELESRISAREASGT